MYKELFLVLLGELLGQFIKSMLIRGVVGQMMYKGKCELLSTEQADPFVDILSLLGPWYHQGRIKGQAVGQCATTYYYIVNLETGVVMHREVLNGTTRRWNGTITRDPDHPQRFRVSYGKGSFDHYVVATNYKEYSLIYGCRDNPNNTRSVWGWLLSREKYYVPTLKAAREVKEALLLNPDLNVTWHPIYHYNCNDKDMKSMTY